MNQQDFDLAALAHYLHLTPQQVERLVSREELPGRKVGGEWRFSRAEVHHWLEDRLGAWNDATLAQMETALERHAVNNDEAPRLSELIRPALITIPLNARTRDSVIRDIVVAPTDAGLLWDPGRMSEAIRAREEMMSTALDNGVALLHPRRPLDTIIAEPFIALALTSQGIPFGGSRSLTDVFFLVASTTDRVHLRTLARLSRILQRDQFLSELRATTSADNAWDLIRSHEEDLG